MSKEALKQEQGEPVAVVIEESTFDGYHRKGIAWNFRLDSFDIGTKFYTTPQQRKPLTEKQRAEIVKNNTVEGYHGDYYMAFEIIDDVEAAHGIKE